MKLRQNRILNMLRIKNFNHVEFQHENSSKKN